MGKYLTVEEAAKISHVHEKTLLKRIKSKKLRAFKPGKCWVIDERDLEAFIKSHGAA